MGRHLSFLFLFMLACLFSKEVTGQQLDAITTIVPNTSENESQGDVKTFPVSDDIAVSDLIESRKESTPVSDELISRSEGNIPSTLPPTYFDSEVKDEPNPFSPPKITFISTSSNVTIQEPPASNSSNTTTTELSKGIHDDTDEIGPSTESIIPSLSSETIETQTQMKNKPASSTPVSSTSVSQLTNSTSTSTTTTVTTVPDETTAIDFIELKASGREEESPSESFYPSSSSSSTPVNSEPKEDEKNREPKITWNWTSLSTTMASDSHEAASTPSNETFTVASSTTSDDGAVSTTRTTTSFTSSSNSLEEESTTFVNFISTSTSTDFSSSRSSKKIEEESEREEAVSSSTSTSIPSSSIFSITKHSGPKEATSGVDVSIITDPWDDDASHYSSSSESPSTSSLLPSSSTENLPSIAYIPVLENEPVDYFSSSPSSSFPFPSSPFQPDISSDPNVITNHELDVKNNTKSIIIQEEGAATGDHNHNHNQDENVIDDHNKDCKEDHEDGISNTIPSASTIQETSRSSNNRTASMFSRFKRIELVVAIISICLLFIVILFGTLFCTIYRRKGTNRFDIQGATSLSPTVFRLRKNLLAEDLDSLKRNRMFGGYDLNSSTDILREEESLRMIGIHHHHPLHRRIHLSNNNNHSSSRKNCNKSNSLKSCSSSTGITLKPIYQPRLHHPAFIPHHHVLRQEDGSAVPPTTQTSMYPYQLPRLSPVESGDKMYFSGRPFPGGANIYVNDTWMVLPFETLASATTFSHETAPPPSYRFRTCSLNGSDVHATLSSRSNNSCEGCRRHSSPANQDKSGSSDEEKSSTPSETNNNLHRNHLGKQSPEKKGTYTRRTTNIHIQGPTHLIPSPRHPSSPVNKTEQEKTCSVLTTDISDTKL